MVGRRKHNVKSITKSSQSEIIFPTGRITRKVKGEIVKFISELASNKELNDLLANVVFTNGGICSEELTNGKAVSTSQSISSSMSAIKSSCPVRKGKCAKAKKKKRQTKKAKEATKQQTRNNQIVVTSDLDQPKNGLLLDLAFAIYCTSAKESYVQNATSTVRLIIEEIVKSKKFDLHLALVEYRYHRPDENLLVTQIHDLSTNVDDIENALKQCGAIIRSSEPLNAVDAIQDVLDLSWRSEANKICVLIADAPIDGLDPQFEGFTNGCPLCFNPATAVFEMAEKHISRDYVDDMSVIPYQDFFISLTYYTD